MFGYVIMEQDLSDGSGRCVPTPIAFTVHQEQAEKKVQLYQDRARKTDYDVFSPETGIRAYSRYYVVPDVSMIEVLDEIPTDGPTLLWQRKQDRLTAYSKKDSSLPSSESLDRLAEELRLNLFQIAAIRDAVRFACVRGNIPSNTDINPILLAAAYAVIHAR